MVGLKSVRKHAFEVIGIVCCEVSADDGMNSVVLGGVMSIIMAERDDNRWHREESRGTVRRFLTSAAGVTSFDSAQDRLCTQ